MSNDEPQSAQATSYSARSKLVSAAHSPLGFFVLALLIVEAFLIGAGIGFGLSETWKLAAIGIGVFLFIMVFWTVVWLVVTRPQNLVFSEESHVQLAALKAFGSDSHQIANQVLKALRPPSPSPQPGLLSDDPENSGED
jgi:hypothetical protein